MSDVLSLYAAARAGDQDAWSDLAAWYRPSVRAWLRSWPAFWASGEPEAYFENRGWERLWRSAPAAEAFSDPPQLTVYLRRCMRAAVVDHNRAWRQRQVAIFPLSEWDTTAAGGEGIEAGLERRERQAWLMRQAQNEAERTWLGLALAGAPPREIYRRHGRLFGRVEGVYAARDNYIARLQRVGQAGTGL